MEKQQRIKDIDTLKGKVLVFGGVYSNFQALEKMQAIAADWGIAPSNIICTGDAVGYCAQPEESVSLIADWGIHCIAGNVEIQLREGALDCGCDFKEGSRCDTFSQQWYPFAQKKLSAKSLDWMKALPEFIRFKYAGLSGLVVHGSYHETADFVFKSTPWAYKQQQFDETNTQLILAGHGGLPFQDVAEGHYWLNAGVIGMPANDGSPKVWFMILEESENGKLHYEHQRFAYEHELAALSMKKAGLPPSYALTLETGLWDNCEILPEKETALQGAPIVF